jgi:hypothetical protein
MLVHWPWPLGTQPGNFVGDGVLLDVSEVNVRPRVDTLEQPRVKRAFMLSGKRQAISE